MKTQFYDREEGGRMLAGRLEEYVGRPNLIVLGLPRGGVPVAHAVAQCLEAPMDIMVVRKLGVPGHEELAMGAVGSGGMRVLNPDIIAAFAVDQATIARVEERERRELARRELAYRGHRPPCKIEGKTVILVDDGIATGATVRAAMDSVRNAGPGRLVVAAPVIAEAAYAQLRREADEVVAVLRPKSFHSVGEWFENFPQLTDRQVQALLGPPCHPVGDQ